MAILLSELGPEFYSEKQKGVVVSSVAVPGVRTSPWALVLPF